MTIHALFIIGHLLAFVSILYVICSPILRRDRGEASPPEEAKPPLLVIESTRETLSRANAALGLSDVTRARARATWASAEDRIAYDLDTLVHGRGVSRLGEDGKLYHVPIDEFVDTRQAQTASFTDGER